MKLEITVVVPEEIAALVQHYIQRELFDENREGFVEFLEMSGVENPIEFMSEMEIGIKHPDDELCKIYSVLEKEYEDCLNFLQKHATPTYLDQEIGEHLYNTDCLTGVVFEAPSRLIELIETAKSLDCAYFRFQKC